MLAPGPRDAGMQLIDARDLAAWLVDMGGAHRAGAGLARRPVAENTADTWAWPRDGGELADWRAEVRATGLDPERERALLAELHA